MTCVLSLALTILVLSSSPAAADPPPDLAANAALKYWQAFATLPEFTAGEKDKLAAECLTMPLDAQARRSVTRAKYALDMMHRGAKQHGWDGRALLIGIAIRQHQDALPSRDGGRRFLTGRIEERAVRSLPDRRSTPP